jgi:hypothetical protein
MDTTSEKVEIIKQNAVIVLKFDREFYARLTMIMQQLIEGKTPEQMEDAAKQIESKNIKDLWVLNYETTLYLLKASEEYCQTNNLTEMIEISKLNPDNDIADNTPPKTSDQ